MTHDPNSRRAFITTILPTALMIFTIAALVLIFGALGQGGTPSAGDEPTEAPTADESLPTVTLDVTEQATIAPSPSPRFEGEYMLMLYPRAETGLPPDWSGLFTAASGVQIDVGEPSSYVTSVDALCAGEAHMAILNAFAYIAAAERECIEGGLATIRMGGPTYASQIVVRPDSGIATIQDLQGKRFCRPDPLSTSGWIIPELMLRANGIDVETDLMEVLDAGGHDGVIHAVYNGDCDAGATFVDARTLVEEEMPDVMEQVVVLAESPPIPNDALVFAPGVPDEVRQAVIDALVQGLADQSDLGVMLTDLYGWDGMQEVDDSFFIPLAQMLEAAGIDNFDDYVR